MEKYIEGASSIETNIFTPTFLDPTKIYLNPKIPGQKYYDPEKLIRNILAPKNVNPQKLMTILFFYPNRCFAPIFFEPPTNLPQKMNDPTKVLIPKFILY